MQPAEVICAIKVCDSCGKDGWLFGQLVGWIWLVVKEGFISKKCWMVNFQRMICRFTSTIGASKTSKTSSRFPEAGADVSMFMQRQIAFLSFTSTSMYLQLHCVWYLHFFAIN